MSLPNTCVIVTARTGFWSPWRKAPKVERDAAAANHASVAALKARKNLASSIDRELKEVTSGRNKLREIIRRYCVLWAPEQYLLPNTKSLKFFEEWGAAVYETEQKAARFFEVYTQLRNNMLTSGDFSVSGLGDLVNISEYPPVEVLKKRFYIKLEVAQVPETGDIRVEGFTDAEKEKLVEMGRKSVEDSYKRIMVSHLKKLLPGIKRFTETLDKEKPRFHNTLLTGFRETIELVRALNLTNHDGITLLCNQCERDLLRYGKEQLVDDIMARTDVLEKARLLAGVVSGTIDTLDPDGEEE